MHSCRRSSGGGNGIVHVRGYRRANGTYVAGYTRSLPRKSSSTTLSGKRTSTCGSAVQVVSPAANSRVCSTEKTVYVRGYTRSNGTHVAGYFRSPPSSKGSQSTKTSSAGNPHNRCSPSISSVAANCSCSPASPPHWSPSAKTIYNTKSMASATHTMANHVRLPPRITVTSASLSSSSQRHSRDPSNVQVSSTRSQCIKSTITQVDTDKMCCHSVQKPKPGITVPIKPDLPVVKAHTNISKQSPASKPCNAIPTPLVKVEASRVKQQLHPSTRSEIDTKKTSADPKATQAKSKSDVFKQHNPALDVKEKQHCSCRSNEEVAQGSISLLASDGDEFSKVAEKFKKAWARQKRPDPPIKFVFKVTNSTLERKWAVYRGTLKERDVKELYHGTKLSCKITMTQKLCNVGSCGICGISSIGLDPQYIRDRFQRFGNGFYLAPNSSKCNDYTQSYDGFKAMLLCDVLLGRRFSVQTSRHHLQHPPTGYNSVYGNIGEDLNYEEQVVYKSEAVLPRYIIVYS